MSAHPLPQDLKLWFSERGFDDTTRIVAVSGGSISAAYHCQSGDSKKEVFVKVRSGAPQGFFDAEAEGLAYLRATCNLNVPDVLGCGPNFIALNYIHSATHGREFWDLLGEQLATLHSHSRDQFGFINDNFIGLSPQLNPFMPDGYAFFAEHRLLYQAGLAYQKAHLTIGELKSIETLAASLRRWIPDQPASLLHGDLWSGNVHVSASGEPVFIDPAVYYGWAEADLAMTLLFGGFPERFYSAYLSHRAIEPGWRERSELYNLYHLLNHLNLFGGSYYSSVMRTVNRYVTA